MTGFRIDPESRDCGFAIQSAVADLDCCKLNSGKPEFDRAPRNDNCRAVIFTA
jgi:hypothetical protein